MADTSQTLETFGHAQLPAAVVAQHTCDCVLQHWQRLRRHAKKVRKINTLQYFRVASLGALRPEVKRPIFKGGYWHRLDNIHTHMPIPQFCPAKKVVSLRVRVTECLRTVEGAHVSARPDIYPPLWQWHSGGGVDADVRMLCCRPWRNDGQHQDAGVCVVCPSTPFIVI